MKQAIRALGWAATIFWIILLFFTVTAVYSAFQFGVAFGDPSTSAEDDILTASLPFNFNNGGFYDISNFNISSRVNDGNGTPVSDSSTFVRLIPRGSNVSVTHNISISLDQIATENLAYLLFTDSVLDVNMTLKLNFANAVPFAISTSLPMSWGAPLSNLTLGNIIESSINVTHASVVVPFSFENHSFFDLNGTLRLEIVDHTNQVVGEGNKNFNAPSQSGYADAVEVVISGDPANILEARLYFETSVFGYGPVVMSLV